MCCTLSAFIFSGCATSNIGQPPRSAIEQLLLSTAADNALKRVKLPQLKGLKTYLDPQFFESYDKPYVLGSIRAVLSENGAILVEDRKAADVIVEPRSGALGIDKSKSLLGIPQLPLIIPGAGTFSFPETVLYGSTKFDSLSKIALLAYRKDGSELFSTKPMIGKSYFHQYTVLMFLKLNFTDIKARKGY
jgi:hypothetical protein